MDDGEINISKCGGAYPTAAITIDEESIGLQISVVKVRMTGSDPIPAGMEDERLLVIALIAFNRSAKDDVIAPIVLPHVLTLELGNDTWKQRHAADALGTLQTAEPVRSWRGELARQMMLIVCQDVDREVSCRTEIRKARRELGAAGPARARFSPGCGPGVGCYV